MLNNSEIRNQSLNETELLDKSQIQTQYENIIQKLEGDIRQHIRLEQQLKLHIDSISAKFEVKDDEIGHLYKENQ